VPRLRFGQGWDRLYDAAVRLAAVLVGTVWLWMAAEAVWDWNLFRDGCRNVGAAEADALVRGTPGLQILDVRSKAEASSGTLPGALLRPFGQPGFRENIRNGLDPRRPVLVYCAGGFRSRITVGWLRAAGFHEIHHLHRGIWSWKGQGLPVEPMAASPEDE
jgi:rhodanese-related sulfurtransferase